MMNSKCGKRHQLTSSFLLLLHCVCFANGLEVVRREYECDEYNRCSPTLESGPNTTSLAVCRMQCLSSIPLWPMPKLLRMDTSELVSINISLIALENEQDYEDHPELLQWMNLTLREQLRWLEHKNVDEIEECANERGVRINISLNDYSVGLKRDTSEKYRLSIENKDDFVQVIVVATNYFGYRHAMETLFQLVDFDDLGSKNFFVMSKVEIEDEPYFAHRGLSLDTARNFIEVDVIQQIIDGMAHSKLNVLHWHMTDSNAFPVELNTHPVNTMVKFGAQDSQSFYSKEDIKSIESYARRRGVRVVPEIDQPAHVGLGWEGPKFANFTVCVEKEPWFEYCVQPPCGQLNPAEKGVLDVLEKIYADLEHLLKFDTFHLGGDEVNLECWRSSDQITEHMREIGLSIDEEGFVELWANFTSESLRRLRRSVPDVETILWGSRLTSPKYLHLLSPEDFIVQPWHSLETEEGKQELSTLIEKGFRVILSGADRFYLDCGRESWIEMKPNWCSPHNGWREIYFSDPMELVRQSGIDIDASNQVLGAEVAIWTEYIDSKTVLSMVFPRASALGERLWSRPHALSPWASEDADSESLMSITNRLSEHRWRLVHRGVEATPVHTEYCRQRPGFCYQADDSPINLDDDSDDNGANNNFGSLPNFCLYVVAILTACFN